MAVLHDHLQGVAQRVLMADQQADLAKVRQLAQFGHAQAEGFAAAQARRLFEHVDGSSDWNALVGGFEQ
ncbi:hypothetical protein D3C78_1943220 [compost metagenome]